MRHHLLPLCCSWLFVLALAVRATPLLAQGDTLVAVADTFAVIAGDTLDGDLGENDGRAGIPADSLTWSLADDTDVSDAGSLALEADGTFRFVAKEDFEGTLTFTYVLSDTANNEESALVTIEVSAPEEDAEEAAASVQAVNDTLVVLEKIELSGDVSANDVIGEGDRSGVEWKITDSSHVAGKGTLEFDADGTFLFTSADDFHGTVRFAYAVCNGDNVCARGKVIITVKEDHALLSGDRSFIFSTGFNFDLIDGVKGNAAYLDLIANIPVYDRLGLLGKINRYRTFSLKDSVAQNYFDIDSVYVADTLNVVNYERTDVVAFRTTRYDNIGLLFAPTYRLSGDDAPAVVSVVPTFEWFRSTAITTYDRTLTTVTTNTIPEDWPNDAILTNALPEPKSIVRETSDLIIGSIAVHLNYRNDFGIFNARAFIGVSSERWTRPTYNGGTLLLRKQDTIWGISLEFVEHVKSGVKIGAELRGFGLNNKEPQATLERNFPWYNVYIAKEFKLSKIGELFSVN